MPNEDRKGPLGSGPIGRGLGLCYGRKRESYPYYYGWGHHGRHRGYKRRFNDPIFMSNDEIENDPELEKKWITQELEIIEKQKKVLTKRLEKLNSKEKTD